MAYIKKLPTGRYCAQIYLGRDPVTRKTRWESKTFDREKDADQWAKALTLHTDGGDYGYMVHWCRTAGPGQPPKFYPVSNGRTAEEAIDRAIARYNRKHGLSPSADVVQSGVVRLPVRGTIS